MPRQIQDFVADVLNFLKLKNMMLKLLFLTSLEKGIWCKSKTVPAAVNSIRLCKKPLF